MTDRGARTERGSWSLLVGVGIVGLVVGYLIGVARSDVPPPTVADEAALDLAEVEPTRYESEPIEESTPEPYAAADPATPSPVEEEPETVEPVAAEPAPELITPENPAAEPAPIRDGGGSRVAVVIDDLGRSVADVVELSNLGVPLTFSVLPFESRTAEVVGEVTRRGSELLLHLPMQPSNGADPGPGALKSEMSAAELEAATRWALAAVEGAIGVNNHMGSELSADRERMRVILRVLAEHDLFFLDSRTSPRSVGYQTALDLGMAAAKRQVFLDPDFRPETIRRQFRELLGVARSRGSAVAIGHPHSATIAVLREEIPLAVAAGYRFVTVSTLARRVSTTAAR